MQLAKVTESTSRRVWQDDGRVAANPHRVPSRRPVTAHLACAFGIIACAGIAPWAPSNAATALPSPYRTFHYQLRMEGQVVAGFSKLTMDPQGKVVLLQQGTTHSTFFETWASQSTRSGGGKSVPIRKDLAVDVRDERGQLRGSHVSRACAVAEYQGVPDLDAGAHAVAITAVKFVCAEHLRPEQRGAELPVGGYRVTHAAASNRGRGTSRIRTGPAPEAVSRRSARRGSSSGPARCG